MKIVTVTKQEHTCETVVMECALQWTDPMFHTESYT
jgi:hypothetical protein